MAAETLSNTFRKEERLCGELRIDALFREGETVMSFPLRACWRCLPAADSTNDSPVKVLISAPKKKLHRAFQRNRAKRLMREAYRLQKHSLLVLAREQDCELQLAIVWQQDGLSDYDTVYAKMGKLLAKIQANLEKTQATQS